jgi:hypothetical protein
MGGVALELAGNPPMLRHIQMSSKSHQACEPGTVLLYALASSKLRKFLLVSHNTHNLQALDATRKRRTYLQVDQFAQFLEPSHLIHETSFHLQDS